MSNATDYNRGIPGAGFVVENASCNTATTVRYSSLSRLVRQSEEYRVPVPAMSRITLHLVTHIGGVLVTI